MTDINSAAGVLLGLACGDALGRPVEFKSAAQIQADHGVVTEMLGHGTHHQPAGTVTDDTELALCIARSLSEHGTFHPEDIASRFVEWYNSDPFDIGLLTASVLRRLDRGESWNTVAIDEWNHLPEGRNAGNGSLMRCAPYGIAFADEPDELTTVSRVSSAITHADPRCQWSCAVLNRVLAELMQETPTPLTTTLDALAKMPSEVKSAVEQANTAIQDNVSPDEIELANSGYVVSTLQAALYHGLTADSAEQAIVNAVNMGGDTDTIGAITGAIAGARFGQQALPKRWLADITEQAELDTLAERLTNGSFSVEQPAKELVASGALELDG